MRQAFKKRLERRIPEFVGGMDVLSDECNKTRKIQKKIDETVLIVTVGTE